MANLAHDLEIETQNHEAARASLQEKQRKVDQQAERLAQLEVESSDVHAKNLELSSHIHEMNLLAEQQQDQLRRQAEAAAAIAVEAVAATAGGGEEDLVGAGGGEGVGNGGYEELEEKLKAAQAMAEFKTRELGAVNARVKFNFTFTRFFLVFKERKGGRSEICSPLLLASLPHLVKMGRKVVLAMCSGVLLWRSIHRCTQD